MCGTAMVALQITADAFYRLSPVEFFYAIKAIAERQDAKSKETYEVARLQAWWIISLTGKELKKPLDKPKDLVVFPWEEAPTQVKQSPEEIARAIKKIALSFGTVPEQQKVAPKKEKS